MNLSIGMRAAVVSVAIFVAFMLAWHIATQGTGPVAQMDPEYAKLMGKTATQGTSAMPGPLDVGGEALGAPAAAVLRHGPERQGRRHPARLFDRARRRSAISSRSRSRSRSAS